MSFVDKLIRYSPDILTGVSLVCAGGTAISYARAQKKAEVVRAQLKEEYGDNPIPKKVAFERYSKVYWRPVTWAAFTVASGLGANIMGHKKLAVAESVAAVAVSNTRLISEKVQEVLSPADQESLKNAIAQGKTDMAIAANKEADIPKLKHTCGDTLLVDGLLTGRVFIGDIEDIRKAVNDYNGYVLRNEWAPVNDFYGMVGLSSVPAGEIVGCDSQHQLDIRVKATVVRDGPYKGRPALCFESIGYFVDDRGKEIRV